MTVLPGLLLHDFKMKRPPFEGDQADLLRWLAKAHARGESPDRIGFYEKCFNRFGCDPKRISRRGSVIEDARFEPGQDDAKMEVYGSAGPGASVETRMQVFTKNAERVMQEFYPSGEGLGTVPDHLIQVTCTGYHSPSAAQVLVSQRGWGKTTAVTHAYHMGCYAAFPAVRMAQGYVATIAPRVDIVHTEMCTLHLDPSNHAPEQMVVQSLFGDGFIKYTASSGAGVPTGLRVLKLQEIIVDDSLEHMSWTPTQFGMKMTLSRDVPDKLSAAVKEVVVKIFCEFSSQGITKERTVFAIHPGGPKIIDLLQDALELREDQVAVSRQILSSYGNMSSATLPHVWEKILRDPVASGTPVMSLAFGPGLTLFAMLALKEGRHV